MNGQEEARLIGSLPDDAHGRLRELYDYWEGLKPEPGLLPGRQHVDPLAIPRLLPFLWLVDVYRDPIRFRYRLVGTEHTRSMGSDDTGKYLDEVHPDFLSSPTGQQHLDVVESGDIGYRAGRPTLRHDDDYRWLERLLLPLARDGRTVDMLMGISVYLRSR